MSFLNVIKLLKLHFKAIQILVLVGRHVNRYLTRIALPYPSWGSTLLQNRFSALGFLSIFSYLAITWNCSRWIRLRYRIVGIFATISVNDDILLSLWFHLFTFFYLFADGVYKPILKIITKPRLACWIVRLVAWIFDVWASLLTAFIVVKSMPDHVQIGLHHPGMLNYFHWVQMSRFFLN